MKKLFLLKKGNMIFYACLWDFGGYSIERITKAVGFTVKAFDTVGKPGKIRQRKRI